MDNLVQQVRKGVDRGMQQVRRTAETLEAETRIFALHRKVGLRVYQLWRAGQLTHPDLEQDLEQIALLEARVDTPGTGPVEEASGDSMDQTRVAAGTASAAGPVSGKGGSCVQCSYPLMAGARFCTRCGSPQS